MSAMFKPGYHRVLNPIEDEEFISESEDDY